MGDQELREQLAAAGEKYLEADRARDQAIAELGAAMRAAHGVVPVTDMASLGHVSRVTVYRLLEAEEK